MTSLRELQHAFAAALRDPRAPCVVTPAANLDVYRHHGDSQFHQVLALGFPVVRRRVGDDYFRQLAHHYRQAHPSRSGDLQWIGREFPAFVGAHHAGTDYEWLGDLARLEWHRELAALARPRPALPLEALADVPPEALEQVVFELQPSLALIESRWPIFSVWGANQHVAAPSMDQLRGGEYGLILASDDGVIVEPLDAPRFACFEALAEDRTLGEAVAIADLDESGVREALQQLFALGLACGLTQRSNR